MESHFSECEDPRTGHCGLCRRHNSTYKRNPAHNLLLHFTNGRHSVEKKTPQLNSGLRLKDTDLQPASQQPQTRRRLVQSDEVSVGKPRLVAARRGANAPAARTKLHLCRRLSHQRRAATTIARILKNGDEHPLQAHPRLDGARFTRRSSRGQRTPINADRIHKRRVTIPHPRQHPVKTSGSELLNLKDGPRAHGKDQLETRVPRVSAPLPR